MSDLEICDLTFSSACNMLKLKEVSSLELTKHCLNRIEKYDKNIGSYLLVTEDYAIKKAKASDERRLSGKALSDLDGVPLAIKDMIITNGIRTTGGSRILENYIPAYSATVVNKLESCGAVVTGKLNLDEFAMGSSGEYSAYFPCHNPWNKLRSPGGSSSGSAAAVAASFSFGSLGTDTGGSIRQPAAFCGVSGLRPTYGRVSRFGVISYASSLDQVGPISKDIKGISILLKAIAGFDHRDSTSVNKIVDNYPALLGSSVKGARVGLPKNRNSCGVSKDVENVFLKFTSVLGDLGVSFIEVDLPSYEDALAAYYIIASAEASSNLSRYDGIRYGSTVKNIKDSKDIYKETRGILFGKEVKRRIILGTYVLSEGYFDKYYISAQKFRSEVCKKYAEAFKCVDAIISPTTPTPAFLLGEKLKDPIEMYFNDVFTISSCLAGLPSISMNSGFSKEGLPIGIQITGNSFNESCILNLAYLMEKELGVSATTCALD